MVKQPWTSETSTAECLALTYSAPAPSSTMVQLARSNLASVTAVVPSAAATRTSVAKSVVA